MPAQALFKYGGAQAVYLRIKHMRSFITLFFLALLIPVGMTQAYKLSSQRSNTINPRMVETTAITMSAANILLRDNSAKQTSNALNGTQVWDRNQSYVGNISGIIADDSQSTVLVMVKNSIGSLPLIMPLPLFLASYDTGLPEAAFYDALAEAELPTPPKNLSMLAN